MPILLKYHKLTTTCKIWMYLKKFKKKYTLYILKKIFFIYKFFDIKSVYIKTFFILLNIVSLFPHTNQPTNNSLHEISKILFNNFFHKILFQIFFNKIYIHNYDIKFQLLNIIIYFFDLYNTCHKNYYFITFIKYFLLQSMYLIFLNCHFLNLVFKLIYPGLIFNLSNIIHKNSNQFSTFFTNYNYIACINFLIAQNIIKINFMNKKKIFSKSHYKIYYGSITYLNLIIYYKKIIKNKKIALFLLIINRNISFLLKTSTLIMFTNIKFLLLIIKKHNIKYHKKKKLFKSIIEY
uniref:Uncharacterized protein n=1 Tax=Lotharella vacuolata TaxID=74820 RepID=A0A0H5BK86_9EUKA|nr:hypothetical protein [Lotharella vacuolata]